MVRLKALLLRWIGVVLPGMAAGLVLATLVGPMASRGRAGAGAPTAASAGPAAPDALAARALGSGIAWDSKDLKDSKDNKDFKDPRDNRDYRDEWGRDPRSISRKAAKPQRGQWKSSRERAIGEDSSTGDRDARDTRDARDASNARDTRGFGGTDASPASGDAKAEAAAPEGATAAPRELVLAWWGDLGAIEYPATGRDPAVVDQVAGALKQFRESNPDALMVDVGGFVGPTCGLESSYKMPPLPLYEEAKVDAVNVGEFDWFDLLPAQTLEKMPKPESVALVTSGRPAGGKRPESVSPAAVVEAGGRSIILAGATRIQESLYSPNDSAQMTLKQDLAKEVGEAIAPLRKKHPGALTILLADLPANDAVDLAFRVGGVDLVLVNAAEETVRPTKAALHDADLSKTKSSEARKPDAGTEARTGPTQTLWAAGRFEAGRMAVGRLRFDEDGSIRSFDVDGVDLVAPAPTKGNLWTWLGLASRPAGKRALALPPTKPIVGINLKDPRAIAEEMGFSNPTIEGARCSAPEDIQEQVSNARIMGFAIVSGGKEQGRLYRVHYELPGNNGNLIVNLVLGADGKIVRATAKVDPMIGLRYVLLSKVLKSWEGQAPSQIRIADPDYPGFADQMRLLKQAFELAEEINGLCR